MPYITKEERNDIHENAEAPVNPGQLNYVLTQVVLEYFHGNGGRYQQINDILGALEGAKLEFYRRVVAPYEDVKKVDNGDVYV